MEATTQGNTTLEGHYDKYKSSSLLVPSAVPVLAVSLLMISEGDCDLPRSYRFCLKLRLGHVSCNKTLCCDEIGYISGVRSSLRMQGRPFQRP